MVPPDSEPETPATQPAYDPYAVLRLAGYRRFLMAGMVATMCGQMQQVAIGWDLFSRTRSYAALGFVGLVQFVPVLLLAIPAGHAADRFNRKHQLIAAQGLKLLASLGLAALSFWDGPVPLIYACLLLAGIGQAINIPARWAFLPHLVPNTLMSNAVTWNSSGWQIASTVGPAVGGRLIAMSGGEVASTYLIAAIGSIVVVALVVPIRARPVERRFEPLSIDSILAGIRFVRRNDLILATLTLDLFAVLLGGATALLPVFASEILAVGPSGLGWLRAAPSVGATVTALVLAHRRPLRRAGPAMLWAVAGFGAATIVFGLSRSFWLSFAMLVLTGALDNISVVVRATLVQVLTPNEMRGRVSAVNAIFIGSSNELGEFESGVTASLFGPVVSVVGGGIGTILVVLAVARNWPRLRRLGPLHEIGRASEPEPVPAAT